MDLNDHVHEIQGSGRLHYLYCVKGVHIQSFSGPYFLAFGPNTERYGVPLHILSEYGKIQARKIPNTDTLLSKPCSSQQNIEIVSFEHGDKYFF